MPIYLALVINYRVTVIDYILGPGPQAQTVLG